MTTSLKSLFNSLNVPIDLIDRRYLFNTPFIVFYIAEMLKRT